MSSTECLNDLIIETEEWRPINDFPGYFVSNKGRVKNAKNHIMKMRRSHSLELKKLKKGYEMSCSILVAKAFLMIITAKR
jgi:hypothetical protein